MSIIAWSETYSVGVSAMDAQHRQIMDLIAEFYAALKSGQGRAMLPGVLERLGRCTAKHFVDEEGLMARYGFPGLEAHRREHQRMARALEGFVSRLHAGSQEGLQWELFEFLNRWLDQHLLDVDAKYAAFLTVRGMDTSAQD